MVRLTRRILATEPMKQYVREEVEPGLAVDTDEAILEYVRQTAMTVFHPAGTCKMGHDDMAVVDARLRVHGIPGLRVVDASIMPTLPSGNTSAPSLMVAEKGAALILADWRRRVAV
jgi:choline dehydrogenase